MKVYLYDKEYAKLNRCGPLYAALWSVGFMLLLLLLICIFTISIIFLEDQVNDMDMLVISIGYIIVLLAFSITFSYFAPTYYLAKTTAYVRDEWGVLWQVQFYQKNSFRKIIVNEETVKDYLFRYLHGESFWNIWWGGKCKITRLEELVCIKTKKQYDVCEYVGDKFRRRKIRIAHAYPDLRRCYQVYDDMMF